MKNTFPQSILIVAIIAVFSCPKLVSAQIKIPSPPPVYHDPFSRTPPKHKDEDENITSRVHTFTIVLNNDSSFEKKAMIYVYNQIHELREDNESKEPIVKPSDTKEIYRTGMGGKKIVGRPFDDCWIFLVDSINIRTYSYTSERDNPPIAYIQKNENSEILPLNAGSLAEMIQDNERST